MTTFKTIESTSFGGVTIDGQTECVKVSGAYDGPGRLPGARAIVCWGDSELFASNSFELVGALQQAGVSLVDIARSDPGGIAGILTLIENRRRPIRDHELFRGLAEELSISLDEYLPFICNDGILNWWHIENIAGKTEFIRTTFDAATGTLGGD